MPTTQSCRMPLGRRLAPQRGRDVRAKANSDLLGFDLGGMVRESASDVITSGEAPKLESVPAPVQQTGSAVSNAINATTETPGLSDVKPKFEMSKPKLPDFEYPAPKAPVDAPKSGVDSPKFDMPKFEMPKFNSPKPAPEAPVAAPPAAEPSVSPSVSTESVVDAVKAPVDAAPVDPSPAAAVSPPELAAEVVPKPEMPKPEMPKLEMPKMERPKFEMPKFDTPKTDMPAPEVVKPKAALPQADVPTPKVDIPTPKADVPTPKVDIPTPKVDAPSLKVDVPAPKVDIPAPVIETPPPKMPEPPAVTLPNVEAPAAPAPASEAADALSDAASSAAAAISNVTDGSSAAVAGATTAVQSGFTRAMEQADGAFDSASGAMKSALSGVSGGLLTGIEREFEKEKGAVEGAVGELVQSARSVRLPPNLQAKLDMVTMKYAGVKDKFDEAPEVYLLLVLLAAGAVGFTYTRIVYGGFKGIYKPVDLLDALNREDNVFVVDVRTEEEAAANGVLDLKRAARVKATSLPIVDVPEAVEGDIDNKARLQLKLNAALICSLTSINAFTKVVIVDSRGSSAKALARAVTDQGYRGYMLGGGYSAWKSSGLATKTGSYEVSPADLLQDKGEEIQEAAGRTADQLRKPRNAALVALGTIGLATIVAYPHSSFQFLGFVGLELTVIVTLLSYESPQAVVKDLTKGVSAVADSLPSNIPSIPSGGPLGNGKSKAAPKSEPPAPVVDMPSKAPWAGKAEETVEKTGPSVSEVAAAAAAEAKQIAASAAQKQKESTKQSADAKLGKSNGV